VWRDPIVDEVRSVRDAYAKRFGYDLEAIYRDLKQQQADTANRPVSLPPKHVAPAKP
jgi:hypothetical protein